MIHWKKIFAESFLILIFLHGNLFSQDLAAEREHLEINLSANLAFGSHYQRLGLNLNFVFVTDHFQANSEVRFYYNFKSPGPKAIYPELVLAQGLAFGYGRGRDFFNPFINSISNQTIYENSIAYSYSAWFNKKRTKQQTGIIALQFNQFSIISENDLLARPMLDRFRTAAFLIQYQYKDRWQAAVNCSMWTGQMGKRKYINDPDHHYKCYMDTTDGIYTNTSAGLLSGQFKYYLGYSQNIQANLGIDAEQVRNAVQNRFMHDMKFISKKSGKPKNCHIPMLDEKGEPYLFRKDQKIRRAKLYWNLFSNRNVFY